MKKRVFDDSQPPYLPPKKLMKHCHLVTTMERGRGRGKYKKGRQDKSRRNGCIVNKEKFTKSPSLTCEGSLLLQF